MSTRLRTGFVGQLSKLFVVRLIPLWLAVLVPAATIAGSVCASAVTGESLDTTFKLAGFLIGLYGLLLVSKGLSDTRRLFGKPSFFDRFSRWCREVRALFVRPLPINASANQVIGDFSNQFDIEVGPSVGATLDERIEALERLTSALGKELKNVRLEAAHQLAEARNELRAEDERIRTLVAEIGKRLEQVSVGGLDLEFVGLLWLISGSVLSTFYEGIATVWQAFV